MGETLIALAQAAIFIAVGNHSELDINQTLKEYPSLNKNVASFVTINKNGTLRGCIGSLQADEPLYKNITNNAKAAALKDERFTPLTKHELPNITIEVSILSEATPIAYSNKAQLKQAITPHVHGVTLTYKNKRATYLPQVWEVLPTFDSFFKHLCEKATLPSDCLRLHPKISTYTVTKYTQKREK